MATIAIQRTTAAGRVPARVVANRIEPSLLLLTGFLAASGLSELLLQRVVYRVGVHIPRDGAFLRAYDFATEAGDLAFRFTAVLLVLSAVILTLWLLRDGARPVAGALLAALLAANLLAWPLRLEAGSQAAPIIFAAGVAWLLGQSLARPNPLALKGATAAAAITLLLGQYRVGFSDLGVAANGVAGVQLATEVTLLASAALLAVAAMRAANRRLACVSALLVAALLGAAYVREPATLAIVSLWATGVTLSLPAFLYLVAFGGVVFAAVAWLRDPGSRHLGIAVALLVVAGVQPQVLHHDITALIALILLSLGLQAPAKAEPVNANTQVHDSAAVVEGAS